MKLFYQSSITILLTTFGILGLTNAKTVVSLTSVDCGKVLIGDTNYKLTEDLTCTETAFFIPEENTELDLADHSISYSDQQASIDGIIITGHHNIVKGPGEIIGYNSSATLSGADNNHITKVTSLDSVVGITLMNSAINKIESNEVTNTSSHGILLVRSNNNDIRINKIQNVGEDSILIFNFGDITNQYSNNDIRSNVIVDSGGNGIKVESQVLSLANGNLILSNSIENSNLQAISLSTTNGTTEENLIRGNRVKHKLDISPAFSDCSEQTNHWISNSVNSVISSDTPDCIFLESKK